MTPYSPQSSSSLNAPMGSVNSGQQDSVSEDAGGDQLVGAASMNEKARYTERAWVDVNLSALRQNMANLRSLLRADTELWAVVKANAYGHGAIVVAETVIEAGANGLCVATLQEGIELRQAGLHCPIMMFGVPLSESDVEIALDFGLEWTISDPQQIALCQSVAAAKQQTVPLHLNVDTGMSRLGVNWQVAPEVWRSLVEADGIEPLSLYSHFATADELAHPATHQQAQRFDEMLEAFSQQQLSPPVVHLSNSAATLADRRWHHDRVRIGLALYGYAPAEFLRERCSLRPVMTVKARITHLKTIPAGTGVSYGHRYQSERAQVLATVAIGYADGVPRRLSGQLQAWVRGHHLQQVGNVTMDQTIWLVPDDATLAIGDIVELFGEGWNAQHWADTLGTIPYEILCGFSARLPRLAVGDR